MKTTVFLKLFFFSLAVAFVFPSCEKKSVKELEQIERDAAHESHEIAEFRGNKRQRPSIIRGTYFYEDGYCDVLVDGQWEQWGLEDLDATFHVTDANSSIITFRSTRYRLLKASIISGVGNSCTETIIGDNYSDDFSTYLRIDSEKIFDCIWPYHEEFDFQFKVYGHPL